MNPTPIWHKVEDKIPEMTDSVMMDSDNVLAVNDCGEIYIAYVSYQYDLDDKLVPEWKLAGRDCLDFDNVMIWTPLTFIPNTWRV